mgnify:FL=1
MAEVLKWADVHGEKYDLHVRDVDDPGSIWLRNFDTFICYVWRGPELGWEDVGNDQFIRIGGSGGDWFDRVALEWAQRFEPEAFR